jgi:hypothetical protein
VSFRALAHRMIGGHHNIIGTVPWGRRRNLSDQTTEPSVVEGAHLQKSLKRQRISTVSLVGVIEVGPFVCGWPRLEPDQDRA